MVTEIIKREWNRFKARSRYEKGFTIVFILGLAVITTHHFFENKRNNDEIENYKGITIGTIVKYEKSGRSGRITYYEYVVGKETYQSIAQGDQWFKGCIQTKSCIGKKYQVEYSKIRPSNSRILWDKPIK